jgi:excisionase family DNA binding protein
MNAEVLSYEAWATMHLMTVAEVAGWARVHPKTVYRWIKDGKLPAIQLGSRTYRVPEPIVATYLNQIGLGSLPRPNGNGQEGVA